MNQVRISASPHPFKRARVDLYAPEGMTILQMLQLHAIPIEYGDVRVWVDADFVPQDMWPRVKPKAAALLTISVQPGKGGGGKNPLRTILSLAVAIAAPYAAGAILPAGIIATTQAGAALITSATTGAIGLVGNLLVNALAPPPTPKLGTSSLSSSVARDSQTLFIEGARNVLDPFGVIPQVLGHHRYVPKLAAKTYTEAVGSQQYVRQVFNWGYGPIDIDHLEASLKIGDTLLSEFDDVEIETSYVEDAPPVLTLYPASVNQVDLSVKLLNVEGYQTRTSGIDADEIMVDFTFPNGIVEYDDEGNKVSRSVLVQVQYSPAGADDWTDVGTFTYRRATTAAIRETVRFLVDRGQYDVRVRRVSGDFTGSKVYGDVYWTAIRSITNESPIKEPGVVVTAIRMRASDQLNGAIDTLSGEVKLICPDWDAGTSSWIDRVTSNPASLSLHVRRGRANARRLADARINFEVLQSWHEYCEERGYEFNAVIDYDGTVRDVCADIAAAGRASVDILDGKWSVVVDREKTVPAQYFTPHNIWGYQGQKSYPEVAHAFRVLFWNREKDWRQDEIIVYADGYDSENATKYETLELYGVTSAEQAYRMAREYIATIILRPEKHIFYCDVENLVATRGELIKFNHDVPLFGLASGRIKSVLDDGGDPAMVTGVTTDEAVPIEEGKTYTIRIRLQDGTSILKTVSGVVGETRSLTFDTPFDIADTPAAGDLFMFGENALESIDLIIHSIECGADFTAKLTCVDAAPGIFSASTGVIPAWESKITSPPEFSRPTAPVIRKIQTGEEVMVRNIDGSISTRMVVTLENRNAGSVEPVVRVREVGETSYREADLIYRSAEKLVLENLEDGKRYDLMVFYKRTGSGSASLSGSLMSAAAAQNNILFEGASARPDNVENFKMSVVGEIAIITWDRVRNIDFDHYEIRFSPELSGVEWGGAQVLYNDLRDNRIMIPLRSGSYLIKAVDRSGYSSLAASVVSSNVGDVSGFNVVETITEDPAFAGDKDNCVVESGQLTLDVLSLGVGTYTFADVFDLGAVYTCRLTPHIVARGKNAGDTLDSWGALDTVSSLDGLVLPGDWDVRFEYRTTEDDPSGTPVWSDWADLVIGDYKFRAIYSRVVLLSGSVNITPSISGLGLVIDMPDRILPIKNIEITSGGARVDFDPPFKSLKSVLVTAQSLGAGDYMVKSSEDETGVDLEFFDSADTSVTRTIDLTAVGYGRAV